MLFIADEYLHEFRFRLPSSSALGVIGRTSSQRTGATRSMSVIRVRLVPRSLVPLPTVMKESDRQHQHGGWLAKLPAFSQDSCGVNLVIQLRGTTSGGMELRPNDLASPQYPASD
jgi:hypothetical protein